MSHTIVILTLLIVVSSPTGATLILTYFTPDFLTWLDEEA